MENGAIVGESSPEKPAGTTYVIWQGGEPKNFELKAEIKLEGNGANSGIQYRSARVGAGADPRRPDSESQVRQVESERLPGGFRFRQPLQRPAL